MAKRRYSTSWNGSSVEVTSRIVDRYGWTTASIDVTVDGHTVLRTGGVMKIRGSHAETFDHAGRPHKAILSWSRGSLRYFPFRLEMDDILIADSRVFVTNWWIAWWPLTVTMALALVWLLMRRA